MPTYHIHDTAVRLCVWDPDQPPKRCIERQHIGGPYTHPPPPYGRDVEPLKEQHEGVEFLGSDMPFWIVNAGHDLFFKTRQTSSAIAKPSVERRQEEPVPAKEGHKNSDIQQAKEPQSSPRDFHDDDGDSVLSSISSSIFADSSPLEIEENAPLNASSGSNGNRRGCAQRKPKSLPQLVQDIVSKPITTAIPVMVELSLSKNSFVESIITNDAQDICVNVFFNGQFASSRVFRSHTAEQKDQFFGGRRIDTHLEVPWVILPATNDDTSPSEKSHESSSFKDRWDKVNQLLLQEAHEWGRAGKYKMFRTPVGEYLAELSKKPVPQNMKNGSTVGRQGGIIDVVISVGRSITVPQWINIIKPRRKLPEYICAKSQQLFVVPEELKPQDKAQILAEFEREENNRASDSITKQKPQRHNSDDGYYFSTVITRKVPLKDSTDESTPIPSMLAGQSMELQEDPPSSQPLALVTPSARLKRGGSLPAMHSSMPRSAMKNKDTAIPTTPTQPRHPNKPKVTPQKSYKGPTPSPKSQKQNPWEYIPFDADKSVAYSTRSKRSKSIPASSPDNLRGQELVDNYLALRNRQLETLPSTPFECLPHPETFEDGVSFTPGVSSEMDSSPCRPSNRSDQQPSSMLHESGDMSKEDRLGLDGAGDARKRKSDASIASENTPTRSSKRKRGPSESRNTSLGSGESPPILPPKSAKRTNVVSRDNKVSSRIPRLEQEACNQPTTDVKGSQAQEEFMGPLKKSRASQPQEPANKKQQRHSGAMSARELSSLLTPHKPAIGVNTSFGASFAETSSTRSTRNLTARQEKVISELKAESLQPNFTKVTATYKKPALAITGVKGTTHKITTQTPVQNPLETSRNKRSEPIPDTDESQTAKCRTAKGRFTKAKKPEQAVSKDMTMSQEGVEASMTPESNTQETAKAQGQKIMPTQSDTTVQADQPNVESTAMPISYDNFWRNFGEPLEKPEVGSSMSTKLKLNIDPGVANALNSKPHQISHRGMNTPTLSSATFTIPKDLETPISSAHTISSSATMKYTADTRSTTSFRKVLTPTLALPVPQIIADLPNPTSREPLDPRPNPVKSSPSRRPASGPITLATTPSASAPGSRQPTSSSPKVVLMPGSRRSASGPTTFATSTPTGSLFSTAQVSRPPRPSKSADLAWKPDSLCADSVVSYATEKMAKKWSDKEYVSQSGCAYRGTMAEKETPFRASGILMGVRFVLGVGTREGEDESGMKE